MQKVVTMLQLGRLDWISGHCVPQFLLSPKLHWQNVVSIYFQPTNLNQLTMKSAVTFLANIRQSGAGLILSTF